MTHKDIYTKFMIEYDKANVTSSYPSLTEYEVATVLDKAYNALIAQKVTGNNIRRSTFESDIKSIADLGPLTDTANEALNTDAITESIAPNLVRCKIPDKMLYFLQATMTDKGDAAEGYDRFENEYNPMDGITVRKLPVKLVNHEAAQKFFASTYNIPWIKNPVCYIEDKYINVVVDPLSLPVTEDTNEADALLNIVYIRIPNTFVKPISNVDDMHLHFMYKDENGFVHSINDENYSQIKTISYFDYEMISPSNEVYDHDAYDDAKDTLAHFYTFECNDTVAEELISLAVAFALENVESSRLNSKLNMRGLEA